MNAHLCVYRKKVPTSQELVGTEKAAKGDPLLRAFLSDYQAGFYDWGDDPSFYTSEKRLNDVRRASWGVCRPDVRADLAAGDFVVFFCGAQTGTRWDYYFVGVGTAAFLLERQRLWSDPDFEVYRSFYNVLARPGNDGALVQYETFHRYHDDWQDRAAAPYVVFATQTSAFNLASPRHVATWSGGSVPETWNADHHCRELEKLLFIDRGIYRRLRTSSRGFGHARLNLIHEGARVRPGLGGERLRNELLARVQA